MKHGTLKIHSKDWVTFFQKINTDITQTDMGEGEGGGVEARCWHGWRWMGRGGGMPCYVTFKCSGGEWELRGWIKRRRVKRSSWGHAAVWRKRGRRGEWGDIWCGVGVYPTSTRTHMHIHACMGPTSLLATQLCKHPTTEHRPQVCQANQRAGRMRKGGTSKPMSQLLGVGGGGWKETQREAGWHNEGEADRSGVKLISRTPTVSHSLPMPPPPSNSNSLYKNNTEFMLCIFSLSMLSGCNEWHQLIFSHQKVKSAFSTPATEKSKWMYHVCSISEWRKQAVEVWKEPSKEGKQRIERRRQLQREQKKEGEWEKGVSFQIYSGSGRDLAVFLQHTEDRAGGGGGGRQIYMVRTALAALEQHTGLQWSLY